MSALALLLVIVAALMHATWNYQLKKSGGGIGILTLSGVIATTWLTPIALYMFWQGARLSPAAIAMMAGSGVIHLAYFLLLDRAYRAGGQLSVVYPLARATGPLLTILFAVIFLGETMSWLAAGGALLIGFSALMLTGNPAKLLGKDAKAGVGFALLCGTMIACYTVWDKQAVSVFLIAPIIFDWGANVARVSMLVPYTTAREPGAMSKAWRERRSTVLIVGVLSPLSYILVLTAMVFTPVSYVAPARELAILFAALIGTQVLNEGDTKRRLIASAGMVLGLAGLALG